MRHEGEHGVKCYHAGHWRDDLTFRMPPEAGTAAAAAGGAARDVSAAPACLLWLPPWVSAAACCACWAAAGAAAAFLLPADNDANAIHSDCAQGLQLPHFRGVSVQEHLSLILLFQCAMQ